VPAPTASLTHGLRADDALALARLVDATYGRCLTVARSLDASEAVAERAVLDAYVALWLARRALPASASDAGLEAWLASALVAAAAGSAARPSHGARLRQRIVGSVAAIGAWWAARPHANSAPSAHPEPRCRSAPSWGPHVRDRALARLPRRASHRPLPRAARGARGRPHGRSPDERAVERPRPLRGASEADSVAPSSDGADGVVALPVAWERDEETAALVEQACGGDPQAFRRLVDRHYARCLRFARNLGLGAEDAEEAVQDTFVRVWDALPRFRVGSPFEPWLFRILGNRCRSALGRRRWWQRGVVADSDAVLAQLPARWGTAAGADEELYDRVRQALDTLPVEQREAFLLRHVEGLEYDEMMTVTGAGLSALKMRVKRASDALRTRLLGATT
jgi:RNA polymerase sigma-70 factor (ECF subfamily)